MRCMRQLIDGPAGPLEVVLEAPRELAQPATVAVVCHPHPVYGGTLDNKVVYTLARCALAAGFSAVRFNFRGVGKSAGTFDNGLGETDDAAAVLAWAQAQQRATRCVLMGFSFGAAVALRLAARAAPAQLVTIAPPLSYFDHDVMPRPECPWLVVHGDADTTVPWPETKARLEQHGLTPQVVVLPGVEHFFHGKLAELRAAVEPVLRALR